MCGSLLCTFASLLYRLQFSIRAFFWQALIRRRVARLRALVLLPSRDLAMQVHAVFERYARGTGLRVGLAIGQTNFLEEQLALVGAAALAGKTPT